MKTDIDLTYFEQRDFISKCNRIVVKIGSNLLSTGGHVDDTKMQKICTEISALKERIKDVVLVSSGAIGAGSGQLGKNIKPNTIQLKQAAASIGQPIIMAKYASYLKKYNLSCGQILLTNLILKERLTFNNAKNTMNTLLRYNIIPIVNENDSVVVDEIMFGDNDRLAAGVADMVEADLLILLTDIAGLYKDFDSDDREILSFVPKVDDQIIQLVRMNRSTGSHFSTGGMQSKLTAAKIATENGVPVIIAHGLEEGVMNKVLDKKRIGTLFAPQTRKYSGRKRWIFLHTKAKGSLTIDEGAYQALCEKGKSLLPSGIIKVEGHFNTFDTVNLKKKDTIFGKGLVNYSSQDIQHIKGHPSSFIQNILGFTYGDEVIHRDNFVKID